jgi:hypothetical protein
VLPQPLEAAVWAQVVANLDQAADGEVPQIEAWHERSVARDRRRLETRRRRLLQAGAAGRLSPEDLALALGQVDARLRALEREPSPAERDGDGTAAREYLRQADAVGRREILRILGIEVRIGPSGVDIAMAERPAAPMSVQ